MEKVNILLSSYNGEKYIAQQLDSLLAQDYPNISIHVRDDGSTDRTRQILHKYEKIGKIKVYEGDNLGFIQSFNWLLRNCNDADYYAWCDQDDLWMPDKISMAVQAIRKEEKNLPLLYISDFYWADAECNPVRRENAAPCPHTLEKRLIRSDWHGFGFTQLFNETCAKGIREKKTCILMPHDDTVYLYCLCCGKIIWGNQPAACFRRHGQNTSQQQRNGRRALSHLLWQIRYFLFEYSRETYYDRDREFLDIFREDLPDAVIDRFELYIRPGQRLRKICFRGRYRDSKKEDLATRMLFLLGKL